MAGGPAVFMSYVRSGDEDDDVWLGLLRERLEHEVSARTGTDFSILADRDGAAWAEHWRHRVEETLDADTMLLVIITPDLFGGAACRQEVARFREREKTLRRDDLIVAVYYASAPAMEGRIPRRGDDLARLLRSRCRADWRDLRLAPATSPAAREAISQLADQMTGVLRADPVAGPAHVVDASRRGGLTSLRAAIKAAKAGDRILVRPGIYWEPLVIDKPLEIVGDGRAEDIVIQVNGNHVVTSQAGSGRIANLTLRQTGGHQTWWSGVFVTRGQLDIDGCDISSPTFNCIVISKGAQGRVRHSRIHDGKSNGVFVNGGRAALEDNDIFANGTGVSVGSGGGVVLRRNRIHDCRMGGVFVNGRSTGTVEDNDIFSNGTSGVTILGGRSAVCFNQIHDHGQCGIVVDGASVTAEGNDIYGNKLWGVVVRPGRECTLRRNRVNGNGITALDVRNGGSATIEDNDLTGNTRGAWSIRKDREPNVKRARNKE